MNYKVPWLDGHINEPPSFGMRTPFKSGSLGWDPPKKYKFFGWLLGTFPGVRGSQPPKNYQKHYCLHTLIEIDHCPTHASFAVKHREIHTSFPPFHPRHSQRFKVTLCQRRMMLTQGFRQASVGWPMLQDLQAFLSSGSKWLCWRWQEYL